jgi:hypothetical protein
MVGASFVTAVAEVIRLKKSITAVGNAQVDTAQSKFGGASALFDGTGDYLRIASDTSFAYGTNNFTIELWIRFTSVPGAGVYDIIYEQRPLGGVATSPTLFAENSKFQYNIGNSLIITGSTTISSNTWYHISVCRSGTSTKLFVNGTQEGSTYSDTNSYVANDIYIATDAGGLNAFAGHIDELRVSKSARYTTGFTPSTTPFVNDDNTVLLLHMDGTDAVTYFEDDNGIRSPLGITSVNTAIVSTTQSKFGGTSAYFDGTTARRLHIAAGTNIIGTAFTHECWIYPTSFAFQNQIITQDDGASGAQGSQFRIRTDGKIDFVYWTTSSRASAVGFTSTGTVSTNTWTHIAAVWTGSTLTIYKNGTSIGSGSIASMYQSTAAFAIGGFFGSAADLYGGYIDEVRISNNARYTTTFTPSTTPFVNDANTILLMHANGTNSSTVFLDDNGSRSQIGIRAVGNAQVDTAQSKFGGASALFDGTGDYLTSATGVVEFGSGDLTIEGWIRLNGNQNTKQIMGVGTAGSPGRSASIFLGGTQKVEAYWSNSGTGATAYNAGNTVVTANTWHHIAMVKSGTNVQIYLNGVADGGGQVGTASGSAYAGQSIFIGADTIYQFSGWLDEIRFSNTARYTANFTAPTAPFQNDANTLLLLHMDGTDASTVFIDDNGKTPI